jgi:hypothetical protein
MHSTSQSQVVWASIVASAIVAGLVTVLIEYLAKPRLEARKERILDADRRKREALYGLRRAVDLTHRLHGFSQSKYRDEPATRERIKRWAGEVEQLVDTAYVTISAPDSLSTNWRYLAGYVAGFLASVQTEDDKSAWKGVSSVFDDLDWYLALFTTPRWRWRRRRTIVNTLIELDADRQRNKKSTATNVEQFEPENRTAADGDTD